MKTYLKHIPILFALMLMALVAVNSSRTTAKTGTLSVKGVWVSCFEYEDLGLNDKNEYEFFRRDLIISLVKKLAITRLVASVS